MRPATRPTASRGGPGASGPELYTLFKIDPTRSSAVLVEMLGREFNGVLGCDYFSAYHKYMEDCGVAVQFCLAHLIRDVKFLTELPDTVTAAYGDAVARGAAAVVPCDPPPGDAGPGTVPGALEEARDEVLRCATGKRAPPRPAAQTMAKRFREHGAELFPVHHHAGGRADQQPGRAGDSVRGDRPAHHAGHAQRPRATLERTHLDRRSRPAPSKAAACSSSCVNRLSQVSPARPLRHCCLPGRERLPLTQCVPKQHGRIPVQMRRHKAEVFERTWV